MDEKVPRTPGFLQLSRRTFSIETGVQCPLTADASVSYATGLLNCNFKLILNFVAFLTPKNLEVSRGTHVVL